MATILESVLTTFTQQPRAAILMSGSGSNARTLLADRQVREQYDITTIVSDNPRSRAADLAARFGLQEIIQPIDRFRTPAQREAYFAELTQQLGRQGIEATLYAGFMKVTTPAFCETFPGVNVHPADLTITDAATGVARYRGMRALPEMRAGEGAVASSMHVVDCPVDTGSVIAVSNRLECPPELSDTACHERLKVHEHQLYPAGLIALADGLQRSDLPLRIHTNA